MQTVVGVRFKKAGKIYYFDPAGLELSPGQAVIVETARGSEYGEVVVGPKQVSENEIIPPLKRVIRMAAREDEGQVKENAARAQKAFDTCLQKIAAHGLPMKLIDVEYAFDGSKVTFYFTAEGRVDFRELVRDLAGTFRTRIELRQIGVRDEAKMIGGLGPCGRPLCCATFLGDFEPVSIRMAKEQNLSLNPTKISGICGRLMCCLKFEAESYKAQVPEAPFPGVGAPGTDAGGVQVGAGAEAEAEVEGAVPAVPAVTPVPEARQFPRESASQSPRDQRRRGGARPRHPRRGEGDMTGEISAAAAPLPARGSTPVTPGGAGQATAATPERRRRRSRHRRRKGHPAETVPGGPQQLAVEQAPHSPGPQKPPSPPSPSPEKPRDGGLFAASARRRRRASMAALRRLDHGGPKDSV